MIIINRILTGGFIINYCVIKIFKQIKMKLIELILMKIKWMSLLKKKNLEEQNARLTNLRLRSDLEMGKLLFQFTGIWYTWWNWKSQY